MLVIRLFRIGKKNQPIFKIVVAEKSQPPRAGVFVEDLGFYNPITKEKAIKEERLKHWLKMGAAPSDTVHNLLVSAKVVAGKKRKITLNKPEPKPESETKEKTEAPKEKPAEPASASAEPVSDPLPEAEPAEVPAAEPAPEPKLTEQKD
ncbi:MAG: 30S ribosomal protein S16 [Candidatus Nealsonbacteria bacterium]|nr:30S ribosomal protein S16 [Candidatus Nealsonbacteria bacterium]